MSYKAITILTVLILSLYSVQTLKAQEIQGIWEAKYHVSISKTDSIGEILEDGYRMIKLEKTQIDTNYTPAPFLIQFLADNQTLLKTPLFRDYRNLRKGHYTLKGDSLITKFDSLRFSMLIKGSQLILTQEPQQSHIILEQIEPKGQLAPLLVSNIIEEDSYWKMKIDTSSNFHGMEIYFTSSEEILIRQHYSPISVTSYNTNYYIDSLKNNLFLILNPPYTYSKSMFRFFSKNNNLLNGQIYEETFFGQEVNNYEVQLEKQLMPSMDELLAIKTILLGTWESKDIVLPAQSHSTYGFESITKQYYTINFSDNGLFKIKYGGNLIREDGAHPDDKSYSGTWTLGKTGNYLKLKYDDGTENLVSLIHLDESSISFSLDIKPLGFQTGITSGFYIQLKRRQN